MTFAELKEKALSLPYEPGVYLMQDASGTIIYVGKAKKLKNRVSQYFQDSAAHTPKTRMMVSKIDDFNVIAAASEFEALVLECSLIKRHMPKYNILLKDDKGYPYLRVDMRQEYPALTLSNRAPDDGASYFGPFGGRYMSQHVIDTLRLTFRLPGCGKKFPRDVGRDRPCLNYHMGNCDGWCQAHMLQADYYHRMEQAVKVLQGSYKQVAAELREQMQQAAQALEFERAAQLRDRLTAIEALGKKQLVTAGAMADLDVVGYAQSEAKACFAVLHYVGGSLVDKEYEIVERADSEPEAVSTLVKQYYLGRRSAPKTVFVPCEMEDAPLFEQLLLQQLGRKVRIRAPKRGDNLRLVELAGKNAREEVERVTSREEKRAGTLQLLQTMLGLPAIPQRMESYDISNIAGTDIVASMVVFCDGRPSKKDYKRFKLEGMDDQDDYGAMRQVLRRRFTHYVQGDAGFDQMPDVLLIDGGVPHANAVRQEVLALGLQPPIFGMVKDNRHRTRALVTPDGAEIGIASNQAVFSLVGRIQEETHRFAITYHKQLRSKRLQKSQLDEIPGVGPARKQALLRSFHSIARIRAASAAELAQVVPEKTAQSVYAYFHETQEKLE